MIIEEKSSNVLLVELYKYIASFQFSSEKRQARLQTVNL